MYQASQCFDLDRLATDCCPYSDYLPLKFRKQRRRLRESYFQVFTGPPFCLIMLHGINNLSDDHMIM